MRFRVCLLIAGLSVVAADASTQELEALAARMEEALNAWADMPDGTPDGHSLCRLIESLPAPSTDQADATSAKEEA